jgi:hypothetical protein|tara:strand:- start:11860 stop:12333 length:474 start_codon:yes stop_codon:yes gene_type:complete
MSDKLITTDNPLTDEERRTFMILVATMIPANEEYGVPAADDERIFGGILAKVEELRSLGDALKALDEMSAERHEDRFSDLQANDRVELLEEFSRTHAPIFRAVFSMASQCYYQDDRVLQSLGMEARAPYPQGFDLAQGDWSLLDPVRQRAKMYRELE